MEKTYERQLESVVAAVPDGGCLLALVPTIERDQAAALASDLAQFVGRGRTGHTLLVSVEDPPAALDHEIGVEGGGGLTQVLAGETSVAQVAAHGRARGFIYVPAGEAAAAASRVWGSRAFRSLVSNAVARGAVVLAFVAEEVVAETSLPGPGGVVWLGSEPDDAPGQWRTIGALLPPGVEPPAPRVLATPAPIKVSSPRSGPDARKVNALRGPLLAALLTVVFVAAAALTVFVLSRSRDRGSFLSENDSLWFSPSSTAASDSTPVATPDSTP
ncbi:MAG: hypothetical protein ACC682_04030 [Gemmatimonadota bacterium]